MRRFLPGEKAIAEMAGILRRGGLVVLPTETFYGLGAHVFLPRALDRIYVLKGRAEHLPLLCLLDGPQRLVQLAKGLSAPVMRLTARFWPGPLTLVLPAREKLPWPLLGPTGGVAVRWTAHPMAQALVAALDAPVVGTSANLSGAPPATRVEELAPEVLGGVEGVLDGGILPGGAPSTVLDCTRWPPTVVREGAVPREALQEIVPLG